MGAEKDKVNTKPKEIRASRLTCTDCAVDIDKLLAEMEEGEPPADKSSHLVFDISHLSAGTLDSTSETSENGAEQDQN